MSFKIIVDSCCDLTGTMLKDPCFVKVPLTIRVENSSFVDDASLDRSDLLWAMKQSEDAPSTACPAPQSYLDAYQCGADDIYVSPCPPCSAAPTTARSRPGSCWKRRNRSATSTCSTPAPPPLERC